MCSTSAGLFELVDILDSSKRAFSKQLTSMFVSCLQVSPPVALRSIICVAGITLATMTRHKFSQTKPTQSNCTRHGNGSVSEVLVPRKVCGGIVRGGVTLDHETTTTELEYNTRCECNIKMNLVCYVAPC